MRTQSRKFAEYSFFEGSQVFSSFTNVASKSAGTLVGGVFVGSLSFAHLFTLAMGDWGAFDMGESYRGGAVAVKSRALRNLVVDGVLVVVVYVLRTLLNRVRHIPETQNR